MRIGQEGTLDLNSLIFNTLCPKLDLWPVCLWFWVLSKTHLGHDIRITKKMSLSPVFSKRRSLRYRACELLMLSYRTEVLGSHWAFTVDSSKTKLWFEVNGMIMKQQLKDIFPLLFLERKYNHKMCRDIWKCTSKSSSSFIPNLGRSILNCHIRSICSNERRIWRTQVIVQRRDTFPGEWTPPNIVFIFVWEWEDVEVNLVAVFKYTKYSGL